MGGRVYPDLRYARAGDVPRQRSVAWKRVRAVIGVLLALYGAAAAVTYGCQRLAVFPAPGEVRHPALEGATLLEIAGSAGAKVFALHVPAPAGAPTVVHFHGNGE